MNFPVWKSLKALKQRRARECDWKEKFLQQENLLTTVDRVFFFFFCGTPIHHCEREFPWNFSHVCARLCVHKKKRGRGPRISRNVICSQRSACKQTRIYPFITFIWRHLPPSSSYWTLVHRFLRVCSSRSLINFSPEISDRFKANLTPTYGSSYCFIYIALFSSVQC